MIGLAFKLGAMLFPSLGERLQKGLGVAASLLLIVGTVWLAVAGFIFWLSIHDRTVAQDARDELKAEIELKAAKTTLEAYDKGVSVGEVVTTRNIETQRIIEREIDEADKETDNEGEAPAATGGSVDAYFRGLRKARSKD